MFAKITATRRAVFLKALGETGNVTVSAERAKLSRRWVQGQRKADEAFDAECRAALRQARDRLQVGRESGPSTLRPGSGQASLGTRGSNKPPRGWGHLDGVELVVRGSGGAGPGRRVQIARARVGQISAAVEDRFLAVLSATCNVHAACAEAGVSKSAIYNHRSRWPGFTRRWDAAVDLGYARLESAVLSAGISLFSGEALPEDHPVGQISVAEALQLLNMHKHRTRGSGARPGRAPREPSMEEVRDEVFRRLAAIRAERELSEEQKAQDRREWALRGGSFHT